MSLLILFFFSISLGILKQLQLSTEGGGVLYAPTDCAEAAKTAALGNVRVVGDLPRRLHAAQVRQRRVRRCLLPHSEEPDVRVVVS